VLNDKEKKDLCLPQKYWVNTHRRCCFIGVVGLKASLSCTLKDGIAGCHKLPERSLYG